MTNNHLQTQTIASQGLSMADYASVQTLAGICNEFESITLKLNSFMLEYRPATEVNDFLCFLDNTLIGYLGLYQFNNQEIEISGMVHPNYRRMGTFSTLLEAARKEIEHRNVRKFIFINAETSESGKLFLQSIGAMHSFSEYWMKLVDMKHLPMTAPVRLRKMNNSDIKFVTQLWVVGFHMDQVSAEESFSQDVTGVDTREKYMIELEGKAIGTISINYTDASSGFIYGFVIHPDYQKRGYGRQSLSLAIQAALDRGCTTVELEVESKNRHALGLYRSCGFEVERANDYYILHVERA